MLTAALPAARAPLAAYGTALRRAASGADTDLTLVDPSGRRAPIRLAPGMWCGPLHRGDAGILDRCHGATLDVGCGPGRLTAALTRRRITAVGIDISPEAVRQARRRGADARIACVFTSRLAPARWRHILLADGNIGIGGDPDRLLARCRTLLTAGGDIIVELAPPASTSWAGPVALGFDGSLSTPFAWATVAADDLPALARAAGMHAAETWTEAGRWFARIA